MYNLNSALLLFRKHTAFYDIVICGIVPVGYVSCLRVLPSRRPAAVRLAQRDYFTVNESAIVREHAVCRIREAFIAAGCLQGVHVMAEVFEA